MREAPMSLQLATGNEVTRLLAILAKGENAALVLSCVTVVVTTWLLLWLRQRLLPLPRYRLLAATLSLLLALAGLIGTSLLFVAALGPAVELQAQSGIYCFPPRPFSFWLLGLAWLATLIAYFLRRRRTRAI